MNIEDSFATYLAGVLGVTVGQDLFKGNAPSSKKVSDKIWWIIASGGDTEVRTETGEMIKSYLIDVYYRSNSYNDAYDQLNQLEIDLNSDQCPDLTGFDTIRIEVFRYPIDDDLDNEERKIGLLQVKILTYKENINVS